MGIREIRMSKLSAVYPAITRRLPMTIAAFLSEGLKRGSEVGMLHLCLIEHQTYVHAGVHRDNVDFYRAYGQNVSHTIRQDTETVSNDSRSPHAL